jgi:hypothetical protein
MMGIDMLNPLQGDGTSTAGNDPVRTLVSPTRIVWVSDNSGQSSVTDAEILLEEKHGQVPEGEFLAGSGCRMENKGTPASVLVDFVCELHGGLQLASGGLSGKDVKVRVRFGESVSEAMAELGERGACNTAFTPCATTGVACSTWEPQVSGRISTPSGPRTPSALTSSLWQVKRTYTETSAISATWDSATACATVGHRAPQPG